MKKTPFYSNGMINKCVSVVLNIFKGAWTKLTSSWTRGCQGMFCFGLMHHVLKENHSKAPIGTYLILFALFRRDIDIYYASKLKLSQAIACEQIAIFGMTYFRSKNRLAHVVICFSLIQQILNLSLIIGTLFII